MPHVPDICGASERALSWLEGQRPPSEQATSLKHLGLLLCERIANKAPGPTGTDHDHLALPAFDSFVRMGRNELLELTGQITLRCQPVRGRSAGLPEGWAKMFGGVALSHARIGDLVAVASLVRAAGRLGLSDPWLSEATWYLLEQQRPDGAFGLFATELAVGGQSVEESDLLLKTTVEVLWALAEYRSSDVSEHIEATGSV